MKNKKKFFTLSTLTVLSTLPVVALISCSKNNETIAKQEEAKVANLNQQDVYRMKENKQNSSQNEDGTWNFDLSSLKDITSISTAAFKNMNIKTVILPPNLEKIEDEAFAGNLIEEIKLNSNLKTISRAVFKDNKIKSIIFNSDNKLEEIGDDAFANNLLDKISLPEGLKIVRGFANNLISQIEFSSSIQEIGAFAFIDNKKLKNVSFPSTINKIGESAFANCDLKNQITFEIKDKKGIQNIGNKAFANNGISLIVLPESINYLSGFNDNEITEIKIPLSVTTIGEKAFENNKIAKLDLMPENTSAQLRYIKKDAFKNNLLKELVVPKRISEIGGFANNEISSLYFVKDSYANIEILEEIKPEKIKVTFKKYNSDETKDKEIVVNSKENVYIPFSGNFAEAWMWEIVSITTTDDKLINYKVKNTYRDLRILEDGFINNKLTNVNLGSRISYVFNNAFNNNKIDEIEAFGIGKLKFKDSNFDNLELNDGLNKKVDPNIKDEKEKEKAQKLIDDEIRLFNDFIKNSKIKVISFADLVTEIGERAYKNLELEKVILSDNITKINNFAFGWNKIKEVVIPSKIEYLSGFNSNEIVELIIPDNVKIIGEKAFKSNKINSLTINNNVEELQSESFWNNPFSEIKVSEKTKIAYDAFEKSKKIIK